MLTKWKAVVADCHVLKDEIARVVRAKQYELGVQAITQLRSLTDEWTGRVVPLRDGLKRRGYRTDINGVDELLEVLHIFREYGMDAYELIAREVPTLTNVTKVSVNEGGVVSSVVVDLPVTKMNNILRILGECENVSSGSIMFFITAMPECREVTVKKSEGEDMPTLLIDLDERVIWKSLDGGYDVNGEWLK